MYGREQGINNGDKFLSRKLKHTPCNSSILIHQLHRHVHSNEHKILHISALNYTASLIRPSTRSHKCDSNS